MQPRLYLDMDDTLVDFSGRCVELIGRDWQKECDKPNWGKFANHPDLFKTLEPLSDARILWNFVHSVHPRVEILTALPKNGMNCFPDVVEHKRDWVRKWFSPWTKVNFGPFAIDKQHHCRTMFDILIDDNPQNIEQWNQRGGTGILHKSAIETIEELRHHL